MQEGMGKGPGGRVEKEEEGKARESDSEITGSKNSGREHAKEAGLMLEHRARQLDDPPATRDAAFEADHPAKLGDQGERKDSLGTSPVAGEGLRARRGRNSSLHAPFTPLSSAASAHSIPTLEPGDGPGLSQLIQSLSAGVLFFSDPGMEKRYRTHLLDRARKKSQHYYTITLGLLVVWMEVILQPTRRHHAPPVTPTDALESGVISWVEFALLIAEAFNKKFNLSMKMVVLLALILHSMAFKHTSSRSLPITLTLGGCLLSTVLDLLNVERPFIASATWLIFCFLSASHLVVGISGPLLLTSLIVTVRPLTLLTLILFSQPPNLNLQDSPDPLGGGGTTARWHQMSIEAEITRSVPIFLGLLSFSLITSYRSRRDWLLSRTGRAGTKGALAKLGFSNSHSRSNSHSNISTLDISDSIGFVSDSGPNSLEGPTGMEADGTHSQREEPEDPYFEEDELEAVAESIQDEEDAMLFRQAKQREAEEARCNDLESWSRSAKVVASLPLGAVVEGIRHDSGELTFILHVAPDALPKSPHEREDFVRELRTICALEHPNIVGCREVFEKGEALVVLLEYCEGGALSSILAKYGALSESQAQRYASGMVQGMGYLHRLGVVHGSINLDMAFLSTKGVVKLCFLAGNQHAPARAHTWAACVAPERLQVGDWGRKTDVWSIGCCVLQMLTNTTLIPNFVKDDFRALLIISQLRECPPLPAHLSTPARDFLQRCLTVDPLQRPTYLALLKLPFLSEHAASHQDDSHRSTLHDRHSPFGAENLLSPACSVDSQSEHRDTDPSSEEAAQRALWTLRGASVYLYDQIRYLEGEVVGAGAEEEEFQLYARRQALQRFRQHSLKLCLAVSVRDGLGYLCSPRSGLDTLRLLAQAAMHIQILATWAIPAEEREGAQVYLQRMWRVSWWVSGLCLISRSKLYFAAVAATQTLGTALVSTHAADLLALSVPLLLGRLLSGILAVLSDGTSISALPAAPPTQGMERTADAMLREIGFAVGICAAMGYALAVWFYCQRTAYWQRRALYFEAGSPSAAAAHGHRVDGHAS